MHVDYVYLAVVFLWWDFSFPITEMELVFVLLFGL